MSTIAIVLIALGVAADAFAASMASGVRMRRLHWGRAVLVAGTFGFFQALMPLIGWALASRFAELVAPVDHWIAFGLLALLGVRMIQEALGPDDEDGPGAEWMGLRRLLLLGVATSIDAAAVGVSFAVLDVSILGAVTIIGLVTFVVSLLAVPVGHGLGNPFRTPAEIIGGAVLIVLGTRILLEHLGVLAS